MRLATVPRKSPPPSSKSSHLSLITFPTLAVSGSVVDPHSSAVTPKRILQSTLSWFTFPTPLRPMGVTPLPSRPAYSCSITMYLSLFSSRTFKLSYAPWHTSQFLSQAQASAFDGFLEGQLGADPGYGNCLQCAALDRARLKTNPVTPRSDICSNCFKKYCYDPQSPPPEGQIVGRRFKFKDPDPLGLMTFYLGHKAYIITGAVVVGLGLIATIAGCVIFWKRRFQRKKTRAVAYKRLSRGDGSEWSALMGRESYDMALPRYSGLGLDAAKSHYSEPSYEMGKVHYAEPSDQMGHGHDAEPSYATARTHYSEPSNETENTHYAEPSYETEKTHYAEPSYEAPGLHYSEPSHGIAHDAVPRDGTTK